MAFNERTEIAVPLLQVPVSLTLKSKHREHEPVGRDTSEQAGQHIGTGKRTGARRHRPGPAPK